MHWNFNVPAIVAQKITLSANIIAVWKTAVWTVKQGQEKFLKAYVATIDEQIPGWRDTWRTDPTFADRLAEIEDYIKALCRGNGMSLTTWNRYRHGARKAMLLGLPFRLAVQNYTVAEARAIADGGAEVAKVLRKEKNLRHAANQVAKHATILPLPEAGDNPTDYIECLATRLAEHLKVVKERLGESAHNKLVEQLSGPLTAGNTAAFRE